MFTVRIASTDSRGNTHVRDTSGFTVREAFAFMRRKHGDAGKETPFNKVRIDKFPQLYVFHMPSR